MLMCAISGKYLLQFEKPETNSIEHFREITDLNEAVGVSPITPSKSL